MKTAKRYRAWIEGKTGLLGAIPPGYRHYSSWFKTRKEADGWLYAVKSGNRRAGNKIAHSGIETKTVKVK